MSDIYPFLQPDLYADQAESDEVYRDVKWDFSADKPIFDGNGEPVIVSGLEAVMSWAWRALHTERFLHEIFSWSYGNEILALAGQQWIREVKEAEAIRYIRECVEQHPRVRGIENAVVNFSGGTLAVCCTVRTDYGKQDMEVSYSV